MSGREFWVLCQTCNGCRFWAVDEKATRKQVKSAVYHAIRDGHRVLYGGEPENYAGVCRCDA